MSIHCVDIKVITNGTTQHAINSDVHIKTQVFIRARLILHIKILLLTVKVKHSNFFGKIVLKKLFLSKIAVCTQEWTAMFAYEEYIIIIK